MTDQPDKTPEKEECISDKPWSKVLNKAAKLATIGLFQEGGKSIGKFILYPLILIFVLFSLSYAIDYFTGWFSSVFDFWPFNRVQIETLTEVEDTNKWYELWKSDPATETVPEIEEPLPVAEPTDQEETAWYCKFNPMC